MARGEQLRRRRIVTRALLRVVPVVAGGLLVTAALVRLLNAPLSAFWIALAVALAGIAVFTWLKGRVPPLSDHAATQLDADAGLSGELRSAHWFASNPNSNAWTAFHLDRASDRVDAVSWPAVYPPVKSARVWAGSAVLGAAAIAVVLTSAWPLAKGSAVPGAGKPAVEGELAGGIPTDLQKQIDELLRAIESGAMPIDEARAKVSDLRDALANLDPKLQEALAKAAKEQMKNAGDKSKDDANSLASRAEKAADSPSLPQDMKWSMEDLASKLKSAGKPKELNEGEESQTEKSSTQGGQKGEAGDPKDGKEAGVQMSRSTAADAQSSQMMASTMAPMGGQRDPNAQSKKGPAGQPLDLNALRKETIEADTDSQGANVLAEMRKKSEKANSTLGFSKVAPLANYDKSHATPPPAPADGVRALLKQYFIRK
jgi:hypothetical protein